MAEGLERLFPIFFIFGWGFILGRAIFDPKLRHRATTAGVAIGLFVSMIPQLVEVPRHLRLWFVVVAPVACFLIGVLISAFGSRQRPINS